MKHQKVESKAQSSTKIKNSEIEAKKRNSNEIAEDNKKCENSIETLCFLINQKVEMIHKDFNPIAQGTPFFVRKEIKINLSEYLENLRHFFLKGSEFVLEQTVRLFLEVCKNKREIVHKQTLHRILGICGIIVAKYCFDGFNPQGFNSFLGVNKKKLPEMEFYIFIDVLYGR